MISKLKVNHEFLIDKAVFWELLTKTWLYINYLVGSNNSCLLILDYWGPLQTILYFSYILIVYFTDKLPI